MKILVIGGNSRIGKILVHKIINKHIVTITTRGSYDLSKMSNLNLGKYDYVIVCACDFKKGRPDKEQEKCWSTNVDGIKNALDHTEYSGVIFLSSYLSQTDTAYGRQKKEVENWIMARKEKYSIYRISRIERDCDYIKVADEILKGLDYENRCCDISV